MVGPYEILKKVGYSYGIDLLATINIHPVFSPDQLQKVLEDLLPG